MAVPELKEQLRINIELAAPDDFIPELPGWQERSPFIAREGNIDFFHYDFYAQALSKIERDHILDRQDVRTMFANGLIKPDQLLQLFSEIEPQLYRYPAIDPPSFRRRGESRESSYFVAKLLITFSRRVAASFLITASFSVNNLRSRITT